MKRSPLESRTPLRRKARLRPMSAKARRRAPARRAAVAEAKARAGGMCEYPGCREVGTDPHERLTRARGGSVTDAGNIVWLCRVHHRRVHERPIEATRLGILAGRKEVPVNLDDRYAELPERERSRIETDFLIREGGDLIADIMAGKFGPAWRRTWETFRAERLKMKGAA